MNNFFSLHCTSLLLLLALGWTRPPPVDIINNHVKLLAETTRSRIQKLTSEFRMSSDMVIKGVEVIPDIAVGKPIEGLSFVAETLHTFRVILHNLPLDGLSQIQTDVMGLQDIVDSLAASLSCPVKASSDAHLITFLNTHVTFHISLANVALTRLQGFLSTLANSLEQLKAC